MNLRQTKADDTVRAPSEMGQYSSTGSLKEQSLNPVDPNCTAACCATFTSSTTYTLGLSACPVL